MFALESGYIAWVFWMSHTVKSLVYEFLKWEKARTQKEIGRRQCVFEIFGLSVSGGLSSPIPYILRVAKDLGVGTGNGCWTQVAGRAWFDVRVEILIHWHIIESSSGRLHLQSELQPHGQNKRCCSLISLETRLIPTDRESLEGSGFAHNLWACVSADTWPGWVPIVVTTIDATY